tara:strand:+ start:7500 stop:7889 length:390 start_codon:yes stop_codon:yes gene_type:complete
MKTIIINNKKYKLHKINNIIYQGNSWRWGYKIDNDNPLSDQHIEIIESHINEGSMLWGNVSDPRQDITWFILPSSLSDHYLLISKFIPETDGAKDYYFNLLQSCDIDDKADHKNRHKAIHMLINVIMEL